MADESMTGTFQLHVPPDLINEAKRAPVPKDERLEVEGWKRSWLGRLSELIAGKD